MALTWDRNPLIYELNAWTWLAALSEKYGQPVTLGSVPDAELDALAAWHFDAVWLMGVWERSPAGRQIARTHPGLQDEYRHALPDYTSEDVVGSPYSVHRYTVDPHLGGRGELAALRAKLAARGLRLLLDFVSNHVAPDHPWLASHPECLLQGTPDEMSGWLGEFFLGPGGQVFAHGRDPYFPPWTDTAQLNAFSPVLRQLVVETLLDIAAQCDGVRCDMAMLVTNRIFAQTWGARAGEVPHQEYWQVVIPAVRAQYPQFLFLAEVYWDMEWELQQQGFDYTYDKRLYDRLKHEPIDAIRGHLRAELAYQQRLVRLIENHDEARAAVALGPTRDLTAAVLITTLPGAALLHEGQMQGHRVKLPVQLGRRPPEQDNPATLAFYRALLEEVSAPVFRAGDWQLREVIAAWESNPTHAHLIAYTWQLGSERRLVVINYTPTASQGRVLLPGFGPAGGMWRLYDVLPGVVFERAGDEINRLGLYVDLAPWQAHLFRVG